MSLIIVISGGTGLIGKALSRKLARAGNTVRILTRTPEKYSESPSISFHFWDWKRRKIDENVFQNAQVFIHLAGANIGAKRWTSAYKAEIAGSRILSLKFIREYLQEKGIRLRTFIGASAIGYYGCITDKLLRTEEDPPGDDFLAGVVSVWEEESLLMNRVADNVTVLRTGVVLDKNEGAFPKMIKPVKMKMPLVLGSGKQYVNWIATDDIADMYAYALEKGLNGIYNAVAPRPVTYKEFVECAAMLLNLFCCLPSVPGFLLKLFLGEMACLVTEGVPVSSSKIRESGFVFKYDRLEKLLRDYLR